MGEKEDFKSILRKLPKCRVEIGYLKDIFWFLGFFLLTFLIPLKDPLALYLIWIYVGVGYSFSMAVVNNFSRLYIILISLFIVIMMFIPSITWELFNIITESLRFVKVFIHTSAWLFLGSIFGSIGRSILNYIMCRRGEL